MRGWQRPVSCGCTKSDLRFAFPPFNLHRFALQQDFNAIFLQDKRHGLGYVRILAGEKLSASLNYRDLAPKAAEHLSKFQSDVASAQDDQMLGHAVELHNRSGVEPRHLVKPGNRRNGGTATGVNEDLLAGDSQNLSVIEPDFECFGIDECRSSTQKLET